MSVSGVGSGGGFSPSKIASRIMKDLDTNGDGSLDKTEFTAGLEKKGVSAGEAGKLFDKIDIKGTGKLTQSDIESSIKAQGAHPPSGGPPGGGPPVGGPPGGSAKAGGATKSGGSTNSSSSVYYDKMDANKDGTVSVEEKLTYVIKHPDAANNEKQNVGNNLDVSA